ncbi:MAG: SDR family NAD(P)-dependent oxidoreductase [Chloroflexota bacterium]|nr:SDR family NAD(P)-dependent oxidoreductase [Chloroflexota bacterium]
MARLEGKVALITGATGGIGRAASRLFAEEGARVALVDLDEGALRELAAEIGEERASYSAADVTQPDQTQAYIDAAVNRWGGIDVLLANAGIEGTLATIPEYPVDMFDRVMAVNVRGVWLGIKYAVPAMRERGGGSIVITSSTAGIGGAAEMSAYNTSKHAVIGMMRCAALECAPHGIRVNTVNPAPIETRMMRSIEEQRTAALDDADVTLETMKRAYAERIPLRRYGNPEEVARMMLFLSSDDSTFCTGGVYMVDGGRSAGSR